MKILFIHSDYLEYEVTQPTKVAEAIAEEMRKGRADEVLACFISVEEGDSPENVERYASEIRDVAEKVKATRVFLYPYAHLSPNLADPQTAVAVLRALEDVLKDEYEVFRAPFGWYKAFRISCKGHPLSELSKEIKAGERLSQALVAEKKGKTKWYIMTPDGVLHDVDKFDFSQYPSLKKFADYEISGTRASNRPSPHVELMRRLEIADYEGGSDPGNVRYYPKGKIIKSIIEEHVRRRVLEYGAMEVETPVMYDYNHPTLRKYLERFPARQYTVKSGEKSLFLRFAACFGQFLMSHDANISYRALPLRMFEMAKYAFRREQRGELVGLKRLRAFTMPDMHTIVRDIEQAKEEFRRQFLLSIQTLRELGLEPGDYEVALRFTEDFYSEHREFIEEIAKLAGRPVLVQTWEKRFFYFVLKFEFNFVDALDKAAALSTVQIDVENAERYDISYVDESGERRRPIILHCSTSGAIERVIYSLLEKAYMASRRGEKPMLPVGLSPVQVRFVPIGDAHLDRCLALAERMNAEGVRADVDDRDMSMNRKIREAEREWIPYIVVIGDREVKEGTLAVRPRREKGTFTATLEDLVERVRRESEPLPPHPLTLPIRVSARPRFTGAT